MADSNFTLDQDFLDAVAALQRLKGMDPYGWDEPDAKPHMQRSIGHLQDAVRALQRLVLSLVDDDDIVASMRMMQARSDKGFVIGIHDAFPSWSTLGFVPSGAQISARLQPLIDGGRVQRVKLSGRYGGAGGNAYAIQDH